MPKAADSASECAKNTSLVSNFIAKKVHIARFVINVNCFY